MTKQHAHAQPKRAFNDTEAAEYLGVSTSFLRHSRMNGDLEGRTPAPRYVKFGKAVRYLIDDLDQWLESHRVDRAAG